MDRLRVDYSRIVRLDVVRLKKPLKSQGPPRQAAGAFERSAITMAATAAVSARRMRGPRTAGAIVGR